MHYLFHNDLCFSDKFFSYIFFLYIFLNFFQLSIDDHSDSDFLPDEYVDGALFTESDSESEVDKQISQLLSEIIENELPRTKTKKAKIVARTEKETSGNNSEKLFPGNILKTTEPNEKFPERDRNNVECGNLESASPPLTKHNLLNEGGNCLESDNSDE